MNSLFALHDPCAYHLHEVMVQMKRRGPPKIRAVWRTYRDRKGWYAVEGSHRIAAACRLAITPIIVPVKLDDEIKHDVSCINTDFVRDIIRAFDAGWRSSRYDYWLEYRFPKLRGPRGGL